MNTRRIHEQRPHLNEIIAMIGTIGSVTTATQLLSRALGSFQRGQHSKESAFGDLVDMVLFKSPSSCQDDSTLTLCSLVA